MCVMECMYDEACVCVMVCMCDECMCDECMCV